MIRRLGIVLIILTTVGCVSVPELNYYTLDLRSSGRISGDFVIDSMRIHVGEAVSRREIMIRTSPTKIEYYATQVWAAGLDEQIGEKLKAELGARPVPAAVHIDVVGELLAFEQVDTLEGADAHVKLELTIRRSIANSEEKTEFSKVYETTLAAGARTAPAVVEALSHATELIASEIAKDLAGER